MSDGVQYNSRITQKNVPAAQQPSLQKSNNETLFDGYKVNLSNTSDENSLFGNNGKAEAPVPYMSSERRNEYNQRTVAEIYKGLANPECSGKNTKQIIQNIHRLTHDNYKYVLGKFDDADIPLTDSIMNTEHLNLEEKKKCMNYLLKMGKKTSDMGNQHSDDVIPDMKKIVNKYETSDLSEADKKLLTADFKKILYRSDTTKAEMPVIPNGKLDGDFQQGNTNDCWLLAGIKGLSMTKEGKALLENSIKTDGKGNVDVTFKGIGKTYKITAKDLKGSNELSSGDADVRALEIAMDRHFKETLPDGRADINENSSSKAFELLADPKKTKSAQGSEGVSQILDEIQKTGMKGKASITAMSGDIDPSEIDAVNQNGDFVEMYNCHAYTLKGADKEYVYLINPHDSSETIKVPLEQYKEKFDLISLTDVRGLK